MSVKGAASVRLLIKAIPGSCPLFFLLHLASYSYSMLPTPLRSTASRRASERARSASN